MVRVTYPDPIFRPVPPFSIDVPADWVLTEFPDSLFVMGPTADPNGWWSNVVVRHERVLRTASLEVIAATTWQDLLAIHPDAKLIDQRLIHSTYLHYVREAEITLEGQPGPVTRIDSFVFAPVSDLPTVDLFQIIWTNPAAAGDERKTLYLHMLRSLRFADAA